MRLTNLVYLLRDGEVLLIEKKRGLGAGKINAPGGKLDEGESAEDAARREVLEETGVRVGSLEFAGVLEFVNNGALFTLCHIFVSGDFTGEPRETAEAKPMWVPFQEVPYDRMWEDDRHWLPHVFEGRRVFGRFWFRDWKPVRHELWLLERAGPR